MQTSRLERIKLGNAVKVGNSEGVFFQSDKYLIEKDGYEIRLQEISSGQTSFTTVFNAVFWTRKMEIVQQMAHEPAEIVGEGIIRRRGRPPNASRAGSPGASV